MASILVCDDERSICQMLEIDLRKEGYKVETVMSKEDARRKIDSAIFDVIVTDIRMPNTIDGMEVHPGDLLHGDENGITVIPAEIADQVATKAREHRDMEQQRLAEILGPEFHKQFARVTEYR